MRSSSGIGGCAVEMFADRGPGVSMEEIARTAGLGVGTLYRRFPDRRAFVEEIAISELRRRGAEVRLLSAKNLPRWDVLTQVVAYRTCQPPALVKSIADGGAVPPERSALQDEVDGLLRGLVQDVQDEGSGPRWCRGSRRLYGHRTRHSGRSRTSTGPARRPAGPARAGEGSEGGDVHGRPQRRTSGGVQRDNVHGWAWWPSWGAAGWVVRWRSRSAVARIAGCSAGGYGWPWRGGGVWCGGVCGWSLGTSGSGALALVIWWSARRVRWRVSCVASC